MTYQLNQQEYEALFAQPDMVRFKHFIARIADWEEVWGLSNQSGWATVESEGRNCIPFWPHPKYAEAFIKGDWLGFSAEPIPLEAFIDNWLPGMQKDRVFIAIFPSLEMQGIIVEPVRVLEALDEELEQY